MAAYLAQRVIAIEDNSFKSYPGNFDYYKSKKRELEKLKDQTRVEFIENEIKDIDLGMVEHRLNYEELNKLYCRKEELSKELDEVMELWLSAF